MDEISFPILTWGRVVRTQDGTRSILRVRVDPSPPSGFIIVTEETTGTFDVWVETKEEVVDFLSTVDIQWGETGG